MKFLGIDYGEKRIGLAVAEDYASATAVATVGSLDEVITFISENGPFESIVIGLPRNIDGEDTHQTAKVQAVAKELSDQLGVELEFVDEFDTSNIARQRLVVSGKDFKQEQVDAEAAAIILNDYLTGLD